MKGKEEWGKRRDQSENESSWQRGREAGRQRGRTREVENAREREREGVNGYLVFKKQRPPRTPQ